MSEDSPTVTFGPSAAETVIREFGWRVKNGVIVDIQNGEPIEGFHGGPVEIENFGGIVKDEDGEPTPIRDNFADISDWVSEQKDESPFDDGGEIIR